MNFIFQKKTHLLFGWWNDDGETQNSNSLEKRGQTETGPRPNSISKISTQFKKNPDQESRRSHDRIGKVSKFGIRIRLETLVETECFDLHWNHNNNQFVAIEM